MHYFLSYLFDADDFFDIADFTASHQVIEQQQLYFLDAASRLSPRYAAVN